MKPLLVHGMHGAGDCLHQRAMLREWMKSRDVWLETPWPCIYSDMVGERLHLLTKGSALRTQAKNAARERARYSSRKPPSGCEQIQVTYPPAAVRKHGSVLAAMAATCGVTGELDFRLPVPPAWQEKAAALIAKWRPTKPILIYRPLVERKEWDCAARNPDHGAYAELFATIRERFFVVSVADLEPKREWLVGRPIAADVTLHAGELDVETIIALVQRAALVYCSPGFAVIMAQAVGTAVACIFGGYESSASFSAGAKFAPYLGIDPITPCQCFAHKHRCVKTIDMRNATARLAAFIDGANQHAAD